jgi:hypothetical protein
VIATVGAVASVPLPVTIPEVVSPSAVKVTLAVAVADVVGVKRTVTVWLPSTPRVNGLPEMTLKGAEVDAVPVTVPALAFCTTKV